MATVDVIKKIPLNRVIFTAGILGLVFILISSFIPDNEKSQSSEPKSTVFSESAYLDETEKRLGDFLKNMEGVGNVKVMITLKGGELYTYAREGRKSVSESKTETDENYVMSGRDKNPVLETVSNPEIKGAVVACDGAYNPSVKTDVYNTVSKILGIPVSAIYVTELK